MQMMRTKFIDIFLSALGAERVEYHQITEHIVSGTAIYDSSDANENQDFVWHATETNVPSSEAILLLKLINDRSLLSIDKIAVSRSTLKDQYEAMLGKKYTVSQFDNIIEELLAVSVDMVDDGQETDKYFIHD